MICTLKSTDKVQLTTSAAGTVDVVCSYFDVSTADPPVPKGSTSGPQLTAITTATTTDICDAPAASTLRNVKSLSIRNKDASLSNDVTIIIDRSATDYEVFKATLATGDILTYTEGIGFNKYSSTAKLDTWLRVISDVTFATAATFADITGLTCALKSGKTYLVEACLFHTNNASTTGSQFGYNIGAAPTVSLFGNYSAVTNSVTAGTMSLGTATARDTAITAQTTGQTATGITLLSGYIQPSADGTFALRATSEVTVASGLVVKAGSWMHIRETDN